MLMTAYNNISIADYKIINYNRLRSCNFQVDFNFSKTLPRGEWQAYLTWIIAEMKRFQLCSDKIFSTVLSYSATVIKIEVSTQ